MAPDATTFNDAQNSPYTLHPESYSAGSDEAWAGAEVEFLLHDLSQDSGVLGDPQTRVIAHAHMATAAGVSVDVLALELIALFNQASVEFELEQLPREDLDGTEVPVRVLDLEQASHGSAHGLCAKRGK
ncbi:unnamed protein product [Parascedosporium putredinis]|uniref:Uncharacterized protein n=1 Tax=Parascedosporium putredinis TaxID=1442378 RepID=A0A9P1MAU8_9PEZI|nr:unnamed protein product [Parascedosporium putredinis]CAI7995016.1 unnamed protein product [Parascedosporium putredinis]